MIINGNIIKEVLIEELLPLAQATPKRVCFIQFGNSAASKKFVQIKMKTAEQLGIVADYIASDAHTTDDALLVVHKAVAQEYDGIVIQVPLPAAIDTDMLLNAIPIDMDIDVLSMAAIEAFQQGRLKKIPPVAAAIETILKVHNISPAGKSIVIRGKGKLVGEPVMMLFDQADISYTALDIQTPHAEQVSLLQQADIIISGIGMPYSLTPNMIKDGTILIDASTSEQSGKLQGDIDPACAAKASLYTPVPGGVGPVTVACLYKNLFL
jgi:methylenetetrahydrofolate dehydrogenase (NADP+)/methenyltetrahydrofolate cyclohydrolase